MLSAQRVQRGSEGRGDFRGERGQWVPFEGGLSALAAAGACVVSSGQSLDDLRQLLAHPNEAERPPAPTSREPLNGAGRAALQQALRLLSIRGYATAELRRRLLRQHEPEAVESALASLAGTSFLDDAAWAASFVGGVRGRERSSALLRRELASRGVKGDEASAALASHDDEAAALSIARRRAASLRRLDPGVRERRLRDFLLRRGFAGALAQRAATAALADLGGL